MRPSRLQDQAATAISRNAGLDGASLQGKFAVLANFADFAAAGTDHHPVDIFAITVSPSLAASYLDWERARGFVEGCVNPAKAALTALRYARDHLGLDAPDLESDIVVSSATQSVEEGEEAPTPNHKGTVPLRLQASREAFANERDGLGPEGCTPVLLSWMCARIIAFIFGLRGKELRSARLVSSRCTPSRIVLSFHPKGQAAAPRVVAHRWAFGVLGPFAWWPSYLTDHGDLASILRGFRHHPVTNREAAFTGSLPAQSTSAIAVAVNLVPGYGISQEAHTELDLSEHSDHGSLNDVIRSFGTPLGFDVSSDTLVAGHWLGVAPTVGASGPSAPRAQDKRAALAAKREARKLAMAAKYGNEAPEHEGPDVVWRVLRLAYFALRETGTDWRDLEPSSGWSFARTWARADSSAAPPVELPDDPPFPEPPLALLP